MRILSMLSIVACYASGLNSASAGGESNFASSFFKAVAEDKSGNVICSPISAEMILMGAGFGAAGSTLSQIRSVIPNTGKSMDRTTAFANAIDSYKEVKLHVASNVFVAKGLSLKSNFQSTIQDFLKSTVGNLDFGNAVEASKTINDWSAAHTNNRIKDLVTPEGITKDSSVILMNAIYFKGLWADSFDPKGTELRPFHANGKTIEQVPTMYKSANYSHGKLPKLKAAFIEIPYKTHDFAHGLSMYIILPNEIDGFIELKKNLDQVTVDMLRGNALNGDVELFLPKFKFESELDLMSPLLKLGLTDMFSDAADFSGIVESGKVKITKIIQKAFLEVNEEGSEAAAVTVAEISNKFGPSEREKFVVNRPFFSVIATESQVTLFSALTVDPRT